MILKSDQSVQWLEFEIFQDIPGLIQAVFLKHGGVSKGPYESLNLGESCGDLSSSVQLNRKKIARILGVSRLVCGHQVHGVAIETIDPKVPCDGLITNQKNIGLLIKHADCQAAIIVDPVKKVIANIHAGWRGNVQNIYLHAVKKFQKEYGTLPENLLVGISPSLGPNHSQFINYEIEFPECFLAYQTKPYYFDLWSLAQDQFIAAGVLPHHIEVARICTYAESDDYFSYRRNITTGRHGTVVAWR